MGVLRLPRRTEIVFNSHFIKFVLRRTVKNYCLLCLAAHAVAECVLCVCGRQSVCIARAGTTSFSVESCGCLSSEVLERTRAIIGCR